MYEFLKSTLQIFGVVFLRFRPVPRIWSVWLVGVNLACLYFIKHPEAQVVLATTGVAVILQALIHRRFGFVRLLGIAHILWIPMFAWMATRTTEIAHYPDLQNWLVILLATNAVSFIVDTVDVLRFFCGERAPHYRWS
ncbi:hypothetical protein [Oceanomicrobium pacificus]|uniref:Uncharacterized protein n=1 Tax=Oceanomicrobium pacificus TaxID=2692916 RepID=A0A6B0TVZ1_9RHOB|nr:hypothetical protein [Oceanomicrobium pacificus]MXU65728.1 hypothetical protein [Oceanomicrobium pacificus]